MYMDWRQPDMREVKGSGKLGRNDDFGSSMEEIDLTDMWFRCYIPLHQHLSLTIQIGTHRALQNAPIQEIG